MLNTLSYYAYDMTEARDGTILAYMNTYTYVRNLFPHQQTVLEKVLILY